MLLEARELSSQPRASYDVCIVGAGPAGIALAHSLANSTLRTCVIESGGRSTSSFTDALRDVESDGIQVKPHSRERVLGGTSTTWAGLSSPLDEIDFRNRSWVPFSGWPIARLDLEPFYQMASRRFRFPAWEHLSSLSWLPSRDAHLPRWNGLEEKTFLAADPPQNFGAEFASVFRSAVDVLLGATVTSLDGDGSGRARGVRLVLPDRSEFRMDARVIVLACGGIENARLLLNSTFACPGGLGNDRGQVGRYFMNHPKANYGTIDLVAAQGPLPGYFGFLYPGFGYAGYAGLRLTPQLQERHRVLNSCVRFEPIFDWSDNPGVDALVSYTKRSHALMRAFRRANRDQLVELRSYAETGDDQTTADPSTGTRHMTLATQIAQHWRTVARYVGARLSRRSRPLVTSIRIRNFMEMAPDPDNRVELSDRTDAFGMRLPRVRHRCGEMDRRSVVRLHDVLRREVAAANWGTLRSDLKDTDDPWPIDSDASHHMGATRMGTNPATSVVNEQCRLHTTGSVCVIGASVFPTSGCANPTYTAVALALRLGDHLRQGLLPGG